jgi:hypothetical protein
MAVLCSALKLVPNKRSESAHQASAIALSSKFRSPPGTQRWPSHGLVAVEDAKAWRQQLPKPGRQHDNADTPCQWRDVSGAKARAEQLAPYEITSDNRNHRNDAQERACLML